MGWIALIVLLLALAAAAALLFIPIRYRAQVSAEETVKIETAVTWFFHALSLQAGWENGWQVQVRVLGFLLLGGKKEEKERKEPKPNAGSRETPGKGTKPNSRAGETPGKELKPNSRAGETPGKEPKLSSRAGETLGMEPDSGARTRAGKKAESAKWNEKAETEKERSPSHSWGLVRRLWKKAVSLPAQIGRWIRKTAVAFQRICGKLKALENKRERFLAFLKDEDNQATFRLLKKQALFLAKHLLPRKAEGWLRFGVEDPYLMGQILTWISPFYGFYGRTLSLTPVFDQRVLEGGLKMRGRIRMGTVAWIVFGVWRDRNFRRWIRHWREA